MYGELGAVRGVVDLSPEHALDEAEAFLAFLGYSILRRTSTTLTAQRRSSEEPVGEGVPNLTVVAMPQPEGGVQIKIRGSDFEGVQARQTEWMGWSESLPRKDEGEADASTDHLRFLRHRGSERTVWWQRKHTSRRTRQIFLRN